MNTYEGSVSLQGMALQGWVRQAQDSQDVHDPLWLELLCDNCVLGITQANVPSPQGQGFFFPLPPVLANSGVTLSVRIANTTVLLGEEITLPKESTADETLLGEIRCDRGLTLSGWAMDPKNPAHNVTVEAKIDGERVAETVANRATSVNAKNAENHGFLLELPMTLADATPHTLTLVDGRGLELPGSPLTICLTPQNLGDWFAQKGTLTKDERTFLVHVLKTVEPGIPGSVADYAAWKQAFPMTPKGDIPPKKSRVRVRILYGAKDALNGQKGINYTLVHDESAEYTLLIQPTERLAPYALAQLVAAQRARQALLVYADSETDAQTPLFKSAWNPYAFCGLDYLGPLLVSQEIAKDLDPEAPYAVARVTLAKRACDRICHLPCILSLEKPIPSEGRAEAIKAWLASEGTKVAISSQTTDGQSYLRVHYPVPAKTVSILIPTRDHAQLLERCVRSLEQTAKVNYEIVIIDNDSREPEACALLSRLAEDKRVTVLPYPGRFNYAAINNTAAKTAKGDVLCFLNNDTEILDPEWLGEMLALLYSSPSVGCVGAKLLWPNHLVQHGGVVVGVHQLAAHVGNDWMCEEAGVLLRNQLVQEYSAVTAACMLTPKELFLELGGFDALRFPVAFNDVDYCLRLRAEHKKILWTPAACLLHHESASRGTDVLPHNAARAKREMQCFRTLWGSYDDPFYNPNLPLSTVTPLFSGLAFPPRARNGR